jgi:hypothetical protein
LYSQFFFPNIWLEVLHLNRSTLVEYPIQFHFALPDFIHIPISTFLATEKIPPPAWTSKSDLPSRNIQDSPPCLQAFAIKFAHHGRDLARPNH